MATIKHNMTPMSNAEFNGFCTRENNSDNHWSRAIYRALLQCTNGKTNTQQLNRLLYLKTARFRNGNLKQHGQAVLAYLKHTVEKHNIGVKWENESGRFQFVESNPLDYMEVESFLHWRIAEEKEAQRKKKEKADIIAEEKAEAEAAKAAEAAAKAKAKAAEKAAKAAAAEAAKAAAKGGDNVAEVKAKAAEAEAEAAKAAAEVEAAAAQRKAARDKLLAAGSGVKAASLLVQLEKALLAGIIGGNVSQLQSIAKAAGELQIMAAGMAMEEAAKVENGAALQLAEVKPTAQSRSAGLKKVG